MAIPTAACPMQPGASNQWPYPSKVLNLALSLSKTECPFLNFGASSFLLCKIGMLILPTRSAVMTGVVTDDRCKAQVSAPGLLIVSSLSLSAIIHTVTTGGNQQWLPLHPSLEAVPREEAGDFLWGGERKPWQGATMAAAAGGGRTCLSLKIKLKRTSCVQPLKKRKYNIWFNK